MRTARSRTSGEYLGVLALFIMAPLFWKNEPPQNPGRFIECRLNYVINRSYTSLDHSSDTARQVAASAIKANNLQCLVALGSQD